MPTGGARRGRRDNGLVAAEYAVVGDVDPRVGEHLLDVLAAGGIAAYLQPAADLHPVTRTSTLPARPTDRLYADREHLDTARGYLKQLADDADESQAGRVGPQRVPAEPSRDADPRSGPGGPPAGPGPGPAELEAAWADIVAGFHVTVDPTAATWPAAEEVPDRDDPTADRPVSRPAGPGALLEPPARFPRWDQRVRPDADDPVDEPSLLDGLDTFGADLADDEDEGYRPPPAPPLPRISSAAILGLVSICAGLLLLLWPTLLPVGRNSSLFLAFTALLAGFVTLIWRLRPGDEEDDDDPDNGARV